MSVIRITKQDLSKKVQDGWKKKALAEHYGLPVTQMTLALKQAGLTIRKFHMPKFELVDEVNEEDVAEIVVEEVETVQYEPENTAQEELDLETEGVTTEEVSEQVTPDTVSVDTDW